MANPASTISGGSKQAANSAPSSATSALSGPLKAARRLIERSTRNDCQDLSVVQEDALLHDCEALIDKHLEGFLAVGIALRIIRDAKLYQREDHDSFEAYCKDRWGFGRSRASQLITAASTAEPVYNCKQFTRFPANEAQVRPLVPLDQEQRIAVWSQVVADAGDAPITAKMVEAAAEAVTPTTDTCPSRGDSAGRQQGQDRPVAADRSTTMASKAKPDGADAAVEVKAPLPQALAVALNNVLIRLDTLEQDLKTFGQQVADKIEEVDPGELTDLFRDRLKQGRQRLEDVRKTGLKLFDKCIQLAGQSRKSEERSQDEWEEFGVDEPSPSPSQDTGRKAGSRREAAA
jgi:hypothetical protein